MVRHLHKNDYILHILLLLLCLIPVILSFFVATNGSYTAIRIHDSIHGIGLPCVFKLVTGYNCPACGMTRSYAYMSHLNIVAAWNMNKAGVLLYIFCIFQIPYRILLLTTARIENNKYIIGFEAAFLILIGLVDLFEFIRQFIHI
jgi:hypothetical protein